MHVWQWESYTCMYGNASHIHACQCESYTCTYGNASHIHACMLITAGPINANKSIKYTTNPRAKNQFWQN